MLATPTDRPTTDTTVTELPRVAPSVVRVLPAKRRLALLCVPAMTVVWSAVASASALSTSLGAHRPPSLCVFRMFTPRNSALGQP